MTGLTLVPVMPSCSLSNSSSPVSLSLSGMSFCKRVRTELSVHCSDRSFRIRSRIWYLSFHRHQHLRDHHLEVLLSYHHPNRQRYPIRGCAYRIGAPVGHPYRQGKSFERGLLQTELTERYQPLGYRRRFRHRYLLPRIPCRSPR